MADEDGKNFENDAKDEPEIRTNPVDLVVAIEPLLRRLKRSEKTAEALDELKGILCNEEFPGVSDDARILGLCLNIVRLYVEDHLGRSGAGQFFDLFKAQYVLPELGQRLHQDRVMAEELEKLCEQLNVKLDRAKPGGGLIYDGKRGPPPSLLRHCIEYVLRLHEKWDGVSELEEANSIELREWIVNQLTRPPTISTEFTSGLSWAEAQESHPFDPADLDTGSSGRIASIINSLKNP